MKGQTTNKQTQELLRLLKPKSASLRTSELQHGMRMTDSDLSQLSSVQDDADRSLERSIETAAWSENHELNHQKRLRYDSDKRYSGQTNLSPNREHLPQQTPIGVGLPPGWITSGTGRTDLRSSKFGDAIQEMCRVHANVNNASVQPSVVPTSGMSKAELRRVRKALKALESSHTGNPHSKCAKVIIISNRLSMSVAGTAASLYEQRINDLVKPSRVRPTGTAESSHEQHWNHLAMPLKVTQQVSGIMQMCNHCCMHPN
jgi:hypothetical protein